MKLLRKLLIGVVLLVVVAVGVIYVSINSIIKTAVERQASASLAVPTTLDSASFSPFAGKLSLSGLNVGSPQPFTAPHMFSLGGLAVEVTYSQLTTNPIHINKIQIDNPDLVVEQNNLKLNIQSLMDQTSQTPTTSGGAPTETKKLIIDELDLNNADVSFMPGLPGLSSAMDIKVPSLTLKNIGNADNSGNGAAIKDVVMQVVTALAGKAGASGGLPADLTKALNGQLSQIASQLGSNFTSQFQNSIGSIGQNLTQSLGNSANNVKDSGKQLQQQMNNLLGGDKQSGSK